MGHPGEDGCLDLSGFRGKPQRLGRNLQKLRGVAQVEPWLYPVLGGLEAYLLR